MSIAFRSDDSVVHSGGTTSVAVNKPSGTIDGDFLLAFVTEIGVATITAPAGWNLIGTQDVDTNLRVSAYYKWASSEGASWTWTLGASVLAWGWVGAFTGVDPTDPVYNEASEPHASGGTSYTTDTVERVLGSIYVAAVGAYHTTTGGTTWTSTGTEYADITTNNVASTNITGAVYESASVAGIDASGAKIFTASQSQTKGVTWIIPLRALFTQASAPFDIAVEMAFGEDPDGEIDPGSWVDVTDYVRQAGGSGISAHVGRSGSQATADPAQIRLILDNRDGRFTPGYASGAYYPNIRRNTPIRVLVDNVGVDPEYELVRAFVDEWPPSWSTGDHDRWVSITASGRFRRLGRNSEPLYSALRRRFAASEPVAYWPMEDASDSTSFASAVTGGEPMMFLGAPSLAASSSVIGTTLPTLANGDGGSGEVPAYSGTEWLVNMVLYLPTEPAGPITLLSVYTNGSGARWRVSLSPGASTGTLAVEALDGGGTDLLAGAASVALDDSFLYGQPLLIAVSAADNGTSVDWVIEAVDADGSGSGATGTTASMEPGTVTSVRVLANSSMAGATVGHIAVFDDISLTTANSTALGAQVGEASSLRLNRLCTEEGVPFNLNGNDDDDKLMGAQTPNTLLNLLLECEAVEGGILFDSAPGLNEIPGGICYMPLVAYLNRDVDITIDLSAGDLAPPFAPTYDDRFIINDMEASRPGGSTARVVDMDGPVGVTAEGRYRATRSFNTYLDSDLPNLAGWEVHIGTVEGMRYPLVRMNFRRSPDLFQVWLESPQIGAKIRLTNLPTGHSPDDVDLIVVGWDMFLNPLEWYLSAVTIPASPYTVGELAETSGDTSDLLGWLDWDTCTLDTAVDDNDTTFLVNADPLDTTTADDFPRDVWIGGELVTVTACSGGSQPQTWTVTRSVNGVAKSHDADVEITLANPIILTL